VEQIVVQMQSLGYTVLRWVTLLLVLGFGIWTARTASQQLGVRDRALVEQIATAETELEQASGEDRAEAAARVAALRRERIVPGNFDAARLVAAACCYAAGLITSALFWWFTLRALDQPARLRTTVAAHLLGQLGKYVPGKAMVVMIRSAAIHRHDGVAAVPAVIAVFVETLTMMACGATWAGLIVLLLPTPVWIRWLAVLLALAAAIPTAPPLFRLVLRRLERSRFGRTLPGENLRYDLGLMLRGWIVMSLTWWLIGLSFWLVVLATPGTVGSLSGTAGISDLQGLALALATIALAMVAGFLSLIPGGAGVRELVITGLLAGLTGTGPALVAAIVVRLLFLGVETATSALAWLLLRAAPPSSTR
jgi:hypothetical protein